jgi:hypothetical protein
MQVTRELIKERQMAKRARSSMVKKAKRAAKGAVKKVRKVARKARRSVGM